MPDDDSASYGDDAPTLKRQQLPSDGVMEETRDSCKPEDAWDAPPFDLEENEHTEEQTTGGDKIDENT